MGTVLEAKHINKSFIGVQALKDISIKINSGEIHCLAGETGAESQPWSRIYPASIHRIQGKSYLAEIHIII